MYLTSGKSPIDPPTEFLSKRQSRQLRLLKEQAARDTSQDEKKGFVMNFQKKHEEEPHHKKFKKVANLVKKAHIASEHTIVIHREEWEEKREAGVRIWVNKVTGDVCDECPWKDPDLASKNGFKSPPILLMNRKKIGPETDEFAGTGALVYDGREVNELFDMLDASSNKNKK